MPSLSEAVQSNLAGMIKDAWHWWVDELRNILPRDSLVHFAQSARTDVWLTRTGVEVEHVAGGIGRRFANDVPLEAFEDKDWEQLAELMRGSRVRVILQPPRVYATQVRLPAAARTRLRHAVALQLQEFSPLEPDRVDWAVGRPKIDGGQLAVDVLLAKRSDLDGLQALFEGLELPCQICGLAGEDLIPLRSVRDPAQWRFQIPRNWLIVAGLLASIPFTTLAGAAALGWSNAAEVKTLQEQVEPKLALERDLHGNEALRAALAPLTKISAASMLLDDLAARLPHAAYVKAVRYQRDGTTELDLVAPDPDIVAGALELDPLLPNLTQVGQTPARDNGIALSYRASR